MAEVKIKKLVAEDTNEVKYELYIKKFSWDSFICSFEAEELKALKAALNEREDV